MLNNVSSADYLITGDSIQQNENVQGLEKNPNSLNPYAKPEEFSDSLEISDKAKELFQKEIDVKFFTSMVLNSPLSSEESASIMELIREGEFIDNRELAEALHDDSDLVKYLLS